jgi:hypothetical protein
MGGVDFGGRGFETVRDTLLAQAGAIQVRAGRVEKVKV